MDKALGRVSVGSALRFEGLQSRFEIPDALLVVLQGERALGLGQWVRNVGAGPVSGHYEAVGCQLSVGPERGRLAVAGCVLLDQRGQLGAWGATAVANLAPELVGQLAPPGTRHH